MHSIFCLKCLTPLHTATDLLGEENDVLLDGPVVHKVTETGIIQNGRNGMRLNEAIKSFLLPRASECGGFLDVLHFFSALYDQTATCNLVVDQQAGSRKSMLRGQTGIECVDGSKLA